VENHGVVLLRSADSLWQAAVAVQTQRPELIVQT
jgi:hypothetical protein